MRYLFIIIFGASSIFTFAQSKKKQDISAINAMCGCYEVQFNFAETFATDKEYDFHENYSAGALEYVFPVEQSKDKIVLQHLLIIGDSMIIKHWRQDWLYENTDLFSFYKDHTWKYETMSDQKVKGQWTQKVFQVDDSPRYEGSSSWVHVDGRSYWENTADAPLPRREFSKRKDYNVMVRRNRQEITADGWVHEQDNGKVLRTDSDQLLAKEKGWNAYVRTDMSNCDLAKNWWSEKEIYWADVRAVWDELFALKQTVVVQTKVNDELLFMKLFALQDDLLKGDYNTSLAKQKIKETINGHLKGDSGIALN